MSELKPCPFCGCADVEIFRDYNPTTDLWLADVYCRKCAASMRAYRFDTDSAKRTAVTRWNRRVGNLLFAALKGSLRRITQKGGQANE